MTPRLIVAAMAVLLTPACQTLGWQEEMKPHTEKRLSVTEVAFSQTLRAPALGQLSADEVRRLRDFIARNGAEARGGLVVTARSGERARRKAVVAALADMNVAPDRVGFAVDDRALAADEVRVEIRRHAVTLPDCPDFTTESGSSYDNIPHSNWGCANAVNLGLMIADPNDLIAGRAEGNADGEALAIGIYRYKTGQTKPLNIDDGNTGDSYGASSQSSSPVLPGGGQ